VRLNRRSVKRIRADTRWVPDGAPTCETALAATDTGGETAKGRLRLRHNRLFKPVDLSGRATVERELFGH
jgi:hypothetical protein